MRPMPYMVGWEDSAALVREEIAQLKQEGRDPQWIDEMVEKSRGRKDDADLWLELQSAPEREDFPFREPDDLEGIRNERGPGMRFRPVDYSDEVLRDRMQGVWVGRCCGCALGKPLENFMGAHNGLSSRERIKTFLQAVSPAEYPLNNYLPLHSPAETETGSLFCPASCRENLAFMESDDDIRYTVIGQRILLDKGARFTTGDVMQAWTRSLSYMQVCTAETQAYRNFICRYPRDRWDAEFDWTWVAKNQNPYREWIGAQIRADSWGYAAPGHPELAAEFAWRDARMTHVKNGIYGEMFVASMIATGFVLDDPLAVIEAGLAEIPAGSRLYRDIRQTIEICQAHDCRAENFEAVLDDIYWLLGHYHPVHTNNNAALVVAALLLGRGDYEKVITIAVMGGWDTDCNGATAGSIFGAMHGSEKIPRKWKAPLRDLLYSGIMDYHPIPISECARRSFDIAKKIMLNE